MMLESVLETGSGVKESGREIGGLSKAFQHANEGMTVVVAHGVRPLGLLGNGAVVIGGCGPLTGPWAVTSDTKISIKPA